jgi:hypothetical protein
MPFAYAFDPERRVVRVSLNGPVRGQQIAETITALYHDPQWQYGYDIIWDGTRITELTLESDDQRGFVSQQYQLARLSGPGRDVLLMVRPIDRMMSEIYATMAQGGPRETHICYTEADAWRILAAPRKPAP